MITATKRNINLQLGVSICHGLSPSATAWLLKHTKKIKTEKTNQFMDNKDAAANVHDSSIC